MLKYTTNLKGNHSIYYFATPLTLEGEDAKAGYQLKITFNSVDSYLDVGNVEDLYPAEGSELVSTMISVAENSGEVESQILISTKLTELERMGAGNYSATISFYQETT
ncbi:MAG: hypothetical protein IJ863_01915 [Spirochaetales bacterium]|nr:hypothetical protein [Spirochaetales bacterium]